MMLVVVEALANIDLGLGLFQWPRSGSKLSSSRDLEPALGEPAQTNKGPVVPTSP